jgi:hypothetical protein
MIWRGSNIRGLIVKFHSLIRYAFALGASLFLAACGGGGAQTLPNQGGAFSIAPAEATFFAGIPSTLVFSGGRAPYSLASSEPTVLPVPQILNGHTLEVIPNNPGTVDAGLAAGSLPIRTVNITARDSLGSEVTAKIHVAHNFLTGYTVSFSSSTCATAPACSGGETVVLFDTVTNGLLYGNRPFRVEIVSGDCRLTDPIGSQNLVTSVNTASDHEGKVQVIMRCPSGIASQVGLIRLIDIGTGASTENAFVISGDSATQGMTALPAAFTFTGADSTQCGTGNADFFVFGGQPPYMAVSSDPNISVSATSPSQPGRFTVTAANPGVCSDTTIVVTDSRLGRTTVSVKTALGAGTPPAPAMTVSPSSLTLGCGQSASVSAVGGSGKYNVSSSDPNISSAVAGSTVTITRNGSLPVILATPVNSTVTVTDGTTTSTVTVTNPTTCSP